MTTYPKYNLEVFPTEDTLAKAAAEFIIEVAKKSIAAKGKFIIALSGGQTPEKLYSLLAEPPFREQIQWKKTFIFWGDERCVPLDDERNNAHQTISIFLDKVAIPQKNIHRIQVNLSPVEAAEEYEKEIDKFFMGDIPVFDLILLGLGTNGHTASLFPGTQVLHEQKPGVKAVYVEDLKAYRITMTAPLINLAHQILFLITGIEKAEIMKDVFSGNNKYPSQLIKPVNGELRWFIDKEAANNLNN